MFADTELTEQFLAENLCDEAGRRRLRDALFREAVDAKRLVCMTVLEPLRPWVAQHRPCLHLTASTPRRPNLDDDVLARWNAVVTKTRRLYIDRDDAVVCRRDVHSLTTMASDACESSYRASPRCGTARSTVHLPYGGTSPRQSSSHPSPLRRSGRATALRSGPP